MSKGLRLLIAVASGLALGAVLWFLFLGRAQPLVCRESQDGWRFNTGQLPPAESFGQTFTTRLDNLARIDVKLGTFRRARVADLELELVEIPVSRPPDPARPWPMVDQGISLALYDQVQLGQTFVPHRDGLSGVWLWVDSRNLKPGSRVRVQVYRAGVVDLPGQLLATSWAKKEELPGQGFHRFAFPPLEQVKDSSLLLVVSVRGSPARRLVPYHTKPWHPTIAYEIHGYLGLRFLSDKGQLDGQPWTRCYEEGETWRPNVSVGRSYTHMEKGEEDYYHRLFPWDYWKGDLVFAPAYGPVLPDGPVLRRAQRAGWSLSDNIFNSFSFKPVPGSQGRSYYFRLVSGKGGGGRAVALADWADRYPAGVLVADGVPYQGGLAFRAYCAVPRGEALERFLSRAVKNKPGLLGRAGTVKILVLTHLLLAAALAGLLVSWVLGRGGRA